MLLDANMKQHMPNSRSREQLSLREALKIRLQSELLNYYRRALSNFLVSASLLGLAAFVSAEDRIPTGFRLERYLHVCERNPFTLATPTPSRSQASPFEKLFLASWLRNGSKDVIVVQNSETNAVQTITTVPNQNNLRLIELRLDANPRLVQAIISDGKEKGSVKFRFDVLSPLTPPTPGAVQLQNGRGNSMGAIPAAVSLQTPSPETAALPDAQIKGFVATVPQKQATVHRYHPGVPRVHTEGVPDSISGTHDASGGAALPNSPRDDQSVPGPG
jgi:hypothetical protein